MSKSNVIWSVVALAVIANAFVFGREYQVNRFLALTGKIDQERFCTSSYYIAKKDEWTDMDDYCASYNNKEVSK